MTVLYTQILNKTTKRILSGEFSAMGNSIREDKALLSELKEIIKQIPSDVSNRDVNRDSVMNNRDNVNNRDSSLSNQSSNKQIYEILSKNKRNKIYFIIQGEMIYVTICDKQTKPENIQKYFSMIQGRYQKEYQDDISHYEFDNRIREMSDEMNRHEKGDSKGGKNGGSSAYNEGTDRDNAYNEGTDRDSAYNEGTDRDRDRNRNNENSRNDPSHHHKELNEVHNVLVENLDALINRGENINNLRDMTDRLNLETKEMSRKVNQIKRNAKFEQYKIYGVIFLVFVVFIWLFFR